MFPSFAAASLCLRRARSPRRYFSAQVADEEEEFDGFGTPAAGDVNSFTKPKPKPAKPNPKGKARPERKASFKDFLAARRAQQAAEEGAGGGGGAAAVTTPSMYTAAPPPSAPPRRVWASARRLAG